MNGVRKKNISQTEVVCLLSEQVAEARTINGDNLSEMGRDGLGERVMNNWTMTDSDLNA